MKGRSTYVEFDGINDLIESENFSDAVNSDMSVLVVFQFTALDTSHSAIFSHKTSSNYSWQLAYKGGSVRVYNGFSSSTNIKIEIIQMAIGICIMLKLLMVFYLYT